MATRKLDLIMLHGDCCAVGVTHIMFPEHTPYGWKISLDNVINRNSNGQLYISTSHSYRYLSESDLHSGEFLCQFTNNVSEMTQRVAKLNGLIS